MTYKEYKETTEYKEANHVYICVNGDKSDIIDETQLDNCYVIGTGVNGDNLLVDLLCTNWDKRYEPNWIAECDMTK